MDDQSIVAWLQRQFPSSRSEARLFTLSEPLSLWNGEDCTAVVVLNTTITKAGGKFSRVVAFIFARSEELSDLCAVALRASFNPRGQLDCLNQSKRIPVNEGVQIEHDDVFPHLDSGKFALVRTDLEKVLQRLEGLRGPIIPQVHPLLNPDGLEIDTSKGSSLW